MTQQSTLSLMCVAVVIATLDTIDAFSINIATSLPTRQAMHSVVHQPSPLYSLPRNSLADGSTDEVVDDYDVTCYIVNEEEIITDHEKPHVVCTSEPEEVSSLCHVMGANIMKCQ